MFRPLIFPLLLLLAGACAQNQTVERAPATEGALPAADPAKGGCPVRPLGRLFDEALPGAGQHDPARLDRAVLQAVNKARCAHRLDPLVPVRSLRHAAELHGRDMVRLAFFDHRSPVPGRTTVSDRLAMVGLRHARAAENLLEALYLDYTPGRGYLPVDPVRCLFEYQDGTRIPRHSYASFAERAVERWLASPGHRDNLLDPALGSHGTAMIPTPDTDLCGGGYLVQVFAG